MPQPKAPWAAMAMLLALAACEAEPPTQSPSLSVGEDAPATAPSPLASGQTPQPLNSPNPEVLPKPGGPFGGLPAAPAPSGAVGGSPRPSVAPPPTPSSPSPLPSPGPGQVLVLSAVAGGPEPPLAGASIEAGAGAVQSDAQGLATVPRANGASLVVRATGASTLVVADWDGAPTTLRLQQKLPPPVATSQAQLPVSGVVVDAEGNPVVRATIEGGDGQGGVLAPTTTDGEGRFRTLLHSVRGADGSGWAIFAVKRGGLQRIEGLAMAQPTELGEGKAALRLVLQAPTADLWPAWDESGDPYEAEAWVQAPNGARCQLRNWRPGAPREPVQRVALPGAQLMYRLVRRNATAQAGSGTQAPWPNGDRLQPELLAYPPAFSLPAAGALGPTTQLSWTNLNGAERYALRLWTAQGLAPFWEGLGQAPRLQLAGYPSGNSPLHADLWAFSGPAAANRELLFVGPKALRLQDEPLAEGRWAWRRLRFTAS